MQGNSTPLFDNTTGKRCLGCKQVLPLSAFHLIRNNKNGKRYPYSYCKPCGRKKRAEWHHTENGQRSHRRIGLRKKLGITLEQYDTMLAAQGGVCAICGKVETRLNRRGTVRLLAVDHDHSTGAIRGLLCADCNVGIGYFKDDPSLLRLAATYMDKHK